MNFDRVIPGVNVPLLAAIILQISGRAEENPGSMHQLTEREIGYQNAGQEDMDTEQWANPIRYDRAKSERSHGQHLNALNIHRVKEPH